MRERERLLNREIINIDSFRNKAYLYLQNHLELDLLALLLLLYNIIIILGE